jgi:hypothetical protein
MRTRTQCGAGEVAILLSVELHRWLGAGQTSGRPQCGHHACQGDGNQRRTTQSINNLGICDAREPPGRTPSGAALGEAKIATLP